MSETAVSSASQAAARASLARSSQRCPWESLPAMAVVSLFRENQGTVRLVCRPWAFAVVAHLQPTAASIDLASEVSALPVWCQATVSVVQLLLGRSVLLASNIHPSEHWGPGDTRELPHLLKQLGLSAVAPLSSSLPRAGKPPLSLSYASAPLINSGVEKKPMPPPQQHPVFQGIPGSDAGLDAITAAPAPPASAGAGKTVAAATVAQVRRVLVFVLRGVAVDECQLSQAMSQCPGLLDSWPQVEVVSQPLDPTTAHALTQASPPNRLALYFSYESTCGLHPAAPANITELPVGHLHLDTALSHHLTHCQVSTGLHTAVQHPLPPPHYPHVQQESELLFPLHPRIISSPPGAPMPATASKPSCPSAFIHATAGMPSLLPVQTRTREEDDLTPAPSLKHYIADSLQLASQATAQPQHTDTTSPALSAPNATGVDVTSDSSTPAPDVQHTVDVAVTSDDTIPTPHAPDTMHGQSIKSAAPSQAQQGGSTAVIGSPAAPPIASPTIISNPLPPHAPYLHLHTLGLVLEDSVEDTLWIGGKPTGDADTTYITQLGSHVTAVEVAPSDAGTSVGAATVLPLPVPAKTAITASTCIQTAKAGGTATTSASNSRAATTGSLPLKLPPECPTPLSLQPLSPRQERTINCLSPWTTLLTANYLPCLTSLALCTGDHVILMPVESLVSLAPTLTTLVITGAGVRFTDSNPTATNIITTIPTAAATFPAATRSIGPALSKAAPLQDIHNNEHLLSRTSTTTITTSTSKPAGVGAAESKRATSTLDLCGVLAQLTQLRQLRCDCYLFSQSPTSPTPTATATATAQSVKGEKVQQATPAADLKAEIVSPLGDVSLLAALGPTLHTLVLAMDWGQLQGAAGLPEAMPPVQLPWLPNLHNLTLRISSMGEPVASSGDGGGGSVQLDLGPFLQALDSLRHLIVFVIGWRGPAQGVQFILPGRVREGLETLRLSGCG